MTPSGARGRGALERTSTSGCVITPTTLPARSTKVMRRESSIEPRRAESESADGVVWRISRRICRRSIGIEQQDLARSWSNLTQHRLRSVLGEAWFCDLFCTSVGFAAQHARAVARLP